MSALRSEHAVAARQIALWLGWSDAVDLVADPDQKLGTQRDGRVHRWSAKARSCILKILAFLARDLRRFRREVIGIDDRIVAQLMELGAAGNDGRRAVFAEKVDAVVDCDGGCPARLS